MVALSDNIVIATRGVEKVYGTPDHPLTVLHGIDLTVHQGEYLAVVGPSGSGKSTLLNILGCLDQPTRGSYHLLGNDMSRLDDQELSVVRRTRIGFIFQSFHLLPHLTVLENVEMPLFYARLPRRQRHARCRELIRRVGLEHRSHHHPGELSGGECQRAAIARALSSNPSLVLADEPTGNLDSATSAEIMSLIHELHAGGSTILLITHDEDIARAAPRRITLRDGRIEHDTRRE